MQCHVRGVEVNVTGGRTLEVYGELIEEVEMTAAHSIAVVAESMSSRKLYWGGYKVLLNARHKVLHRTSRLASMFQRQRACDSFTKGR